MTDIVDRLRAGNDYDTRDEAADEIERLRAELRKKWCRSCGAVSSDETCDCTAIPELAHKRKAVDYAEATIKTMKAEIDRLSAELAEARAKALEEAAQTVNELTCAQGQRNAKDQWREQIGIELAAAIRALATKDATP